MYPSVKEVTPHEDYTLLFVFENGESGTLDIKPMLHFGVFRRIQDLHQFMRVQVSFDTTQWDCGVDLDPEYIYAKSRSQSHDQ